MAEMTVSTLVLAVDRRLEARILPALTQAGHRAVARVGSASEVVRCLAEHRPDAVLVQSTRRQLTAGLIAQCDRLGTRIVAFAASEMERRHAAMLGLHEVLDASVDWAEVDAILDGIDLRAGLVAREPVRQPSRVLAVWGPAGAPGRTTLAIEVAAEIAAAGHRVALVDADTYGGQVAPVLGMLDESPGFAAACRLAANDGLTFSELERVAQRYLSPRGDFSVLTGLASATRWPEISGQRVAAVVKSVREWADYTVIDTGFNLELDEEISSDLFAPRRNAATLAAIDAADHVIAVGLADPVGMARFLRAHPDLVARAEATEVTVVMNQVRAQAVGPNPVAQVQSALRRFGSIEAKALVPYDRSGMDAARLTGRTLGDCAPRSPAHAAIARFVTQAVLPQSAGAPARGFRRRRMAVV